MNNLRVVSRVLICLFILFFSLIAIFPFYIMCVMGTHYNEDLFTGIKLLPGKHLLENLRTVFTRNIGAYYTNSLYIAALVATGGAIISASAGFAFSKYRFRFKNALFILILGTLMIPKQLGIVGFVMEMKWFHINNTHLPLIIPPMANAFGVFWMTQFIGSAIPNEILESARIDGCADLSVLARIIFPNIKGGLITMFLLFFLWSWNDYFTPLILLNREQLYTLPLGIKMLGQTFRVDYAARILALSVSTVPVLVLLSFGSKYLMRGFMTGSVKA